MDEAPPAAMPPASMPPAPMTPASMSCGARLELVAVPGVPLLEAGDDLGAVIDDALRLARLELRDGDVVVVASKAVSRAEGRFVDVASVVPSPKAEEIGRAIGKDARMVELILSESSQISRTAPGVLIVRHKLGFVSANAGIDCSNAVPTRLRKENAVDGKTPIGEGPWALLLPEAPDASAERIRARLSATSSAKIGVVISDSFGRPFRLGTVGAAIGVAGIPALWDRRGEPDLFGRTLEFTITALADQVAAAADLVAGQAAERRAVVVVRGLSFPVGEHSASDLLREPKGDLYL